MQYGQKTDESSDSEEEDDDLQNALALSMEVNYNQGQASNCKAGALERASQPVSKVSDSEVPDKREERSKPSGVWTHCSAFDL